MSFMKKLITELLDLSDRDKAEIFLLLFVMAACASVVMLGITWSRGNDVEYFKERIILMDQRMTVIDKKLHDEGQRLDKIAEYSNETRRALDAEVQRNAEQDRWIEEWKKLPHLPKPRPITR